MRTLSREAFIEADSALRLHLKIYFLTYVNGGHP
jgi:hypothetical protein